MSTNYIAPIWRMPRNANKDKLSNYSIDFSGTDFINCGNFTGVNNSPTASWCGWFKPSGTTGGMLFSQWSATTSDQSILFSLSTSLTRIDIYLNTNIAFRASGGSALMVQDEWNFVCLTFNKDNVAADRLQLYINNSRVTETTGFVGPNANINNSTADFLIAGYYTTTQEFLGNISNFTIFDYALDLNQRDYLYNLNNPMAITGGEPIAYWPLGDNSNPNAPGSFPNISVGADSVFDFNTSPSINTKKFSDFDISTEFSFSTWVNFDSESSWDHVIGNPGSGQWSDGFGLYLNGSGIVFWVGKYNGSDNSGNPTFVASGNTDIHPNRWYHITCTYSNSAGGKMYINSSDYGGVQKTFTFSGDASDSTNAPWINTTDITIGIVNNNATYAIDGKVSNVQIWNKKLSDADTITLWNNGQPLMTGTQPQAANLKAWYKLNQSANWEADTAGNWQIPDAVSSYPQSFDFDGNDFIDLGTTTDYDTGDLSVSVWVNITDNGTTQYIFSNSGSPSFLGFDVKVRSSNEINVSRSSQLKSSTSGWINVGFVYDVWQHLAFTFNYATNTIKLFLNGELKDTSIGITESTSLASKKLTIGSYKGTSAFTNGKISNAQIWDTTLLDSQVAQLYNNGVPLTTAIATDNLKAWYKLDNTEVWSADNTYYTIDRWDVDNNKYPSYFKTALEFNANEYVSLDLDGTGGSSSVIGSGSDLDLTFSYWVNPNYQNSRGSFKWGTGPGTATNWFINITHGRFPNRFFLNVYNDGIIRIQYDVPTTDIWYHLIVTRTASDNTWRMYVNDALVGSYSDGGTVTAQNYATKLFLGNGRNNSLEGFISNAYIWNSSLSATDRTLLYNNGSPLSDLSSLSAQPFSWWKLDNKTTGVQDSIGTNNATITGGRVANTLVSTQAAYSSGMTEQNLVNNNVSALNGESSGMNTTNLVQSNLTRKQPFSSYSVYFDGAGDTFDIPDATVLKPQNITVSMWINGGAQTSNYRYPLAKYYTGGGPAYGFTTSSTTDKIGFIIRKGNDTGWVTTALTSVMDDTWHHIVGTFNGTTVSLYVDGVLTSGVAAGATGITYGSGDLTIGAFQASSLEYAGNMSNVAIWDSALNQDDIINIYNNGVPQDLSNFRITPIAWYPMDQSYTYFNGSVLVARDTISGNDGTGANVIQENIVGDAPGSDANGTGNNLAIADLKGNMYNSDKNAYSINMADYADGVTNPANSGRSTDTP
jgi:hypothetical protein